MERGVTKWLMGGLPGKGLKSREGHRGGGPTRGTDSPRDVQSKKTLLGGARGRKKKCLRRVNFGKTTFGLQERR